MSRRCIVWLLLDNLGKDLGITEQEVFLLKKKHVNGSMSRVHRMLSTYLTGNLDRATTIGRKKDLITSIDLERDVLTFLVQGTLTNSNNDTFVQSFLGLLGNVDTRGSFLDDGASECTLTHTITHIATCHLLVEA